MAQKVARVGIKKESGYLYFVDKQGDISRAKMARGGQKKKRKAKKKVTKRRATKKKTVKRKAKKKVTKKKAKKKRRR